jgi:hypothetical protein
MKKKMIFRFHYPITSTITTGEPTPTLGCCLHAHVPVPQSIGPWHPSRTPASRLHTTITSAWTPLPHSWSNSCSL